MKKAAIFSLLLVSPAFLAHAASDYAGEETRAIKALSPERLQGLGDGAGLGYAKAAELNGYPGPAHVLEHAQALHLSGPQLNAVQAIHARMRAAAIKSGEAFIAAERALEAAFASGGAGPEQIDRLAADAGRAEARVRASHLKAHIETTAVLTRHQIERYRELRGYGQPNRQHGHGGGHGRHNH